MACAYGIEQECDECRICSNKDSGKKMTNYEKIKEMSTEELAKIFEDKVSSFDCDICSSKYAGTGCCNELSCKPFARKWLKEWLESECNI